MAGIDLPGEAAGLVPSPEWKKSRASSSADRLRRLELELENTTEEIKHILRLMEGEKPSEGRPETEHIESLKARAQQLDKDVARERERLELFRNERAWVPGDTRNMAIGQGNVLVTPLQIARLACAIANGGKLLRPHLVVQPGENYLQHSLPVSAHTIEVIRDAMREVVFGRHGTAHQSELQKHKAAAKTGTAEIGVELNNGWIVGFAPHDRPQVAFAVVVERTKLHGGDVAGPIAAKILDAYFGKDSND